MLHAYSAAAVRAAERPLLAAGKGPALVQRAAAALAYAVIRQLRLRRGGGIYGARVTLLAGPGNNGRNALFAGAFLAARGVSATALLTAARSHPDALAAFVAAGGRVLRAAEDLDAFLSAASRCDALVDGLLGIGGTGELRPDLAAIVTQLCQIRSDEPFTVVACDVPSGVNATTGQTHGPVLSADVTVTFGAAKAGLLLSPAEQLCGVVEVVDVDLTQSDLRNATLAELGRAAALSRLQEADLARLLPSPAATSQKYSRGVAGIVAGSAQYPGAALLAVAAASACGPGMVRYLGAEKVAAAIHQRNPEVVCSEEQPDDVHVQAWLVGPGIDGSSEQESRAREAMASGLPTVVDAGALPLLPALLRRDPAHTGIDPGRLVLTPHAGELSTLLCAMGVRLSRAEIEASPLAAAQRAAQLTGTTVLLKGPTTVVVAPDGNVFTQADGNARLATAGSGDTLAGILVALLAMKNTPGGELAEDTLVVTAALAAALHGRLARRDPHTPLNAGMLAARIPEVWASLVDSADAK